MEDFERRVRDSFAQQQFMATLGASVSVSGKGNVEIEFPYHASLTQQNGFVHAGAITSILDSACGYAALSVAPPGCDVLSAEFKTNLLAPAVGDRFVARATVKRAGKTLIVCAADCFAQRNGSDKLVATMLGTIMVIQPK